MPPKLASQVEKIMTANRREHDGCVYTVPSPGTYPYQWLWDSCFHAIILSHFDVDAAKAELRSLFTKQFSNGMIPHMIYWEPGEAVDIDWGKGGETSSLTQPPLCAYAVWRVYQVDKDISFLEDTYRSLFHFYQYLLNDRDPHRQHLIGIINPDESGEDNSPRFDQLLGLDDQHPFDKNFRRRLDLVEKNKACNFDAPFCMKDHFWVKDVPFNAIMVEGLDAMSRIADKLGRTRDARYFSDQRSSIISAMYDLMQGEDGLFYSTHGKHYQKINKETWAIFAPMFAGIVSDKEAEVLVEKYLTQESKFQTQYPVPTVPQDNSAFSADDMWRGPTWIGVNWFIYRGLQRYGYNSVAGDIKDGSQQLLQESGFCEYYNPFTGEGLGAKQFTWGGLVIDMQE